MVGLNKVLVAIPFRKDTNPRLVNLATELFNNLTWEDKELALYVNDYGYSKDYSSNARARNDLVKIFLNKSFSHVLWVDVDIIEYPKDLIERLYETADIAAPRVILRLPNKEEFFYDTAGFWDKKHWGATEGELESVGACYLMPANVFFQGGKYEPSYDIGQPEFHAEHWSVMKKAKELGYKIRCNNNLKAIHAWPMDFSMPFSQQ